MTDEIRASYGFPLGEGKLEFPKLEIDPAIAEKLNQSLRELTEKSITVSGTFVEFGRTVARDIEKIVVEIQREGRPRNRHIQLGPGTLWINGVDPLHSICFGNIDELVIKYLRGRKQFYPHRRTRSMKGK